MIFAIRKTTFAIYGHFAVHCFVTAVLWSILHFFLLQQRSRYETWLPNITEIVPPPNLTGWTWPWVHSNIIFKKTENHHARQTFMLASLLFPWPRSAPPNFLILESPLTRKFEKDLCKAPERPHVEQVRNLENLWNGIKNSNTFAFHKF